MIYRVQAEEVCNNSSLRPLKKSEGYLMLLLGRHLGVFLPSHLELQIFTFPVANDKASLLSRALLGFFFWCPVQDVDPALQQARVRHMARQLFGS